MQAELGHGLNQEIAGLRLNEATRLLRETDLKLESVAREVGYGSATYLCRVIQSAYGISPGEYRKNERRTISGESEIGENRTHGILSFD